MSKTNEHPGMWLVITLLIQMPGFAEAPAIEPLLRLPGLTVFADKKIEPERALWNFDAKSGRYSSIHRPEGDFDYDVQVNRDDQGQITSVYESDFDRFYLRSSFQAIDLKNKSFTTCKQFQVGVDLPVNCYTVNHDFCDRLSKVLRQALDKIKRCNEDISKILSNDSMSKTLATQHNSNVLQSKQFKYAGTKQPYFDVDKNLPVNQTQEIIQNPASSKLENAIVICKKLDDLLPEEKTEVIPVNKSTKVRHGSQ